MHYIPVMESQEPKILSVHHISEEEFHSVKEEPEERSESVQLPPLPDLIPIAEMQPLPPVVSLSLEELCSLLEECPLCPHQISQLEVLCSQCCGIFLQFPSHSHLQNFSLVSKVNCLNVPPRECHFIIADHRAAQ